MPKIINLQQRSPEWHAWRKGYKISASMIPVIMELSVFQTPLQLYDEILNGTQKPVTPAMQRGIDMEPLARDWLYEETGFEYEDVCIEHDEYPHFIASLDAYNPEAIVKAHEIKCVNQEDHLKAKLGVVPSHYYPQLQWQMYVGNFDSMGYVSFVGEGKDNELIIVKRDEKFIEKAIVSAKAFRSSLIDLIPPEPTDKDLIEIVDPRAIQDAFELANKKAMVKELEKEIEEMEANLKSACDGRSCRIGEHRYIQFTRKGNIDYAKIPELIGVNLDKYRKPPQKIWRFT